MTLDKAKRGQIIRIISIPHEPVRVQAIRFGISEGEVVECEEVLPAGPVVLRKYNQEIAIGRKLARKIEIQAV